MASGEADIAICDLYIVICNLQRRSSNAQDISAEKETALKRTRIPKEDVNKKRPQSSCPPPHKRQGETVCVVRRQQKLMT